MRALALGARHRLARSIDEYNRIIYKIAHQQGVVLIEGELEIPGDGEHFVDSVHFSDKGSRAMARRVVRALSGSERFEKLVGGTQDP